MSPPSTILIIDQDDMIVTLLVDLLTDAGYHAVGMAQHSPAFAAVTHAPPALLLLDVDRSTSHGGTIIDALAESDLALMPVVLLTTTSRETPPQRVFAAVDVLYKPFDFDVVLTCVAHYTRPINPSTYTYGAML